MFNCYAESYCYNGGFSSLSPQLLASLMRDQRNNLIVFGQDRNGKNFSTIFNTENKSFDRLPTPRDAHFINYCGVTQKSESTIIVCGGIKYNLMGISEACFEYDLRLNKVKHLPCMNQMRYTFPIAYFKGKIWAIGGRIYGDDSNSILKKCEVFDYAKNKWTKIGDLNIPRCTSSAVIYGETLWVFGGYTGQFERSRKVERYNEKQEKWEIANFKILHGFENGNLVAGDNPNELIIFGGKFNYGPSTSVQRYDLARKTVIVMKPLRGDHVLSKHLTDRSGTTYLITQPQIDQPRLVYEVYNEESDRHETGSVSGAIIKDMVKFKQYNFNSPNIVVWKENVETEELIDYKDLNVIFGNDNEPFQLNIHKRTGNQTILPLRLNLRIRNKQGCVRLGEQEVFFCGGSNRTGQRLISQTFIYNLREGTIKRLPPMSRSRHSFAIAKLNNFIYVCGGKEGLQLRSSTLQFCERFDLKNEVWESIAPMNQVRANAEAVVYKNRLYIVGGSVQNDILLDTIEIWDEEKMTWFAFGWNLPLKMSSMLLLPTDNYVFIGGGNMGLTGTSKKWKVDFSEGDLTTAELMDDYFKDGCYGCKYVHVRDKIIVFGGSQTINILHSSNFQKVPTQHSIISRESSPATSLDVEQVTTEFEWNAFEKELRLSLDRVAFTEQHLRDNPFITSQY